MYTWNIKICNWDYIYINRTTSKISGMKKELGPRWRNLFKLSKFQRKGDGRTSEEIEMQRNSEEYSFRPKITSYKKFEKEEVKGFNDKVIADFAARMQKVRDVRLLFIYIYIYSIIHI